MTRDLEQNPIRVAVIGLGRWGNTIAEMVGRPSGLALTACFTRSKEKRDAFAAKFGCDR